MKNTQTMPDSAAESPGSQVTSEGKRSIFPSLRKWQDWWEPDLDLPRLRAKKLSIERIVHLFEMRQKEANLPAPPQLDPRVEALAQALNLSNARTGQLTNDVLLTARWHNLPDMQRALQIGRSHHIEAVAKTAKLAHRLYREIGADAVAIEELINEGAADDNDIDLLDLNIQLQDYIERARRVISQLGIKDGGRRLDARRNVAIALATQAVEEATDTRVEITRPSDGKPWRFTNPTGRFLRDFMQLLVDDNERLLVGALAKIRRSPR